MATFVNSSVECLRGFWGAVNQEWRSPGVAPRSKQPHRQEAEMTSDGANARMNQFTSRILCVWLCIMGAC